MGLRDVARWLLPPALAEALRRRSGVRPEHEIVGETWPAGETDAHWDDEAVAETLAERWPAFVAACEGTGPLSAAHEAEDPSARNDAFHNTYVTFGYVLGLAALDAERISVLDWGGGLGHYQVLARRLLPEVELDYHLKDLPAFASRGRALVPEIHFHTDESCCERTYDLVIASGSLQYSPDWKAACETLVGATGRYLYVTRLPVFLGGPSVVVRQHAEGHGIDASFLGWFLGRDEFVGHVESLGMTLVREFYVQEFPCIATAAEQPEVRGYLFAKGRR